MDNLFDYVGLQLPQANLIVSDAVIKDLAKKSAENAGRNVGVSPQLLFGEILSVLQDYFKPKYEKTPDPNLRNSTIQTIGSYLIMQDILECRSMKEVNALSTGLYDSIVSQLAMIIRTTAHKENELKISPYVENVCEFQQQPYVMQAAE